MFPGERIERTKKRILFGDPAAQNFLHAWAAMNDSIEPRFVSRDEWDARGGNEAVLEPGTGKKKNLFLPNDIHVWELVPIIQAVDKDTYADHPERAPKRTEAIQQLGKQLEHAGVYVAKHAHEMEDGRYNAMEFAMSAYEYGTSLQSGKPVPKEMYIGEKRMIEKIAEMDLSEAEKVEVDQWLLGPKIYERRMERIHKANNIPPEADVPTETLEQERTKLLSKYFAVLGRALDRRKTPEQPWKESKSVATAFLERADANMTRVVELPQRELLRTFYDRGVEMLLEQMGFSSIDQQLKDLGFSLKAEYTRLYEALEIDRIKAGLATTRQVGNPDFTAQMQKGAARKIQAAVGAYRYNRNAADPARMIDTQELNCVGASVLGGALLNAVGIPYLHAHVPEHALVWLVTDDNRVYWHDMLGAHTNGEITQTDLETGKIEDIVGCAHGETSRQQFSLTEKKHTEKVQWTSMEQPSITVYRPEIGQQMDLLLTIAVRFQERGQYQEAARTLEEALRIDPHNAQMQIYHADCVTQLGGNSAGVAEQAYKTAIALDGSNPSAYLRYGCFLASQPGKTAEAQKLFVEAAKQVAIAVEREPKSPYVHHLSAQIAHMRGEQKLAKSETGVAETLYRQAIKKNPGVALSLQQNLAHLLEGTGRSLEVLNAYQVITRLNPNNVHAQTELSQKLQKRGHWLDALPHSEVAARLNPNAETVTRLARNYDNLKQFDRAEAAWRQVDTLTPNDWNVQMRIARSLREQKKYDEAISTLQHAIDTATPPRFNRLAGDSAAIAQVTASAEKTQNALLKTELAIVYSNANRVTEADATFKSVITEHPEYPYGLLKFADFCAEHNRFDEARQAYHGVTEKLGNDSIQAYTGLSTVLAETGGTVRENFSTAYHIIRLNMRKFFYEAQREITLQQEYAVAAQREKLETEYDSLPAWKRLLHKANIAVRQRVLTTVGGRYYQHITT